MFFKTFEEIYTLGMVRNFNEVPILPITEFHIMGKLHILFLLYVIRQRYSPERM